VRTFTCFVVEEGASVPTLSLVLAKTEDRARRLVRMELLHNQLALSVDVYEDGKLLWTERA
jgi:hypothetical protein